MARTTRLDRDALDRLLVQQLDVIARHQAKYQIVVLRFTPRQIHSEPAQVIKDISDALDGARGRHPVNLRTVPAADGRQLDKGAA